MRFGATTALFVLLYACDATDPSAQALLDIAGAYADDNNVDHVIAESDWVMVKDGAEETFAVLDYDNSGQTVLAQNDANNSLHPGSWSRFDWTFDDANQLWICHTLSNGGTSLEAESATAADATAPADGGCNGEPWLRLQEPLPVRGDWVDNWETHHAITQTTWTQETAFGTYVFHITSFDNADQTLVAQNDSANGFNPDLWSRFDWTLADDTLWYCQTTFDSVTEEAAESATPADNTDPSTGGCGGFAWSSMSEAP